MKIGERAKQAKSLSKQKSPSDCLGFVVVKKEKQTETVVRQPTSWIELEGVVNDWPKEKTKSLAKEVDVASQVCEYLKRYGLFEKPNR